MSKVSLAHPQIHWGNTVHGCVWKSCVPLNPMVNDHYPYWMAIIGNIPYFQTNPHKSRVERYSVELLCRTGACTLQASYSDKGGDEVLQSRRHSWILSDQRSVGIQVEIDFRLCHHESAILMTVWFLGALSKYVLLHLILGDNMRQRYWNNCVNCRSEGGQCWTEFGSSEVTAIRRLRALLESKSGRKGTFMAVRQRAEGSCSPGNPWQFSFWPRKLTKRAWTILNIS